jgi:hypothetical protein
VKLQRGALDQIAHRIVRNASTVMAMPSLQSSIASPANRRSELTQNPERPFTFTGPCRRILSKER